MHDQDHYRVISAERLARLHASELARFTARTKKSAALLERGKSSMVKGVPMSWMHGLYRHPSLFVDSGAGSTFHDVDGNRYVDFNVVDLAMTMGFSNPHINAAVGRAMNGGGALPVTGSRSHRSDRGTGPQNGSALLAVHTFSQRCEHRSRAYRARDDPT